MIRDNLEKRNLGKPTGCEFCNELESISHLFFDCIVAKNVWSTVSDFFQLQLGTNYEFIARLWLANKKHGALNLTINPYVLLFFGAFGKLEMLLYLTIKPGYV